MHTANDVGKANSQRLVLNVDYKTQDEVAAGRIVKMLWYAVPLVASGLLVILLLASPAIPPNR